MATAVQMIICSLNLDPGALVDLNLDCTSKNTDLVQVSLGYPTWKLSLYPEDMISKS